MFKWTKICLNKLHIQLHYSMDVLSIYGQSLYQMRGQELHILGISLKTALDYFSRKEKYSSFYNIRLLDFLILCSLQSLKQEFI